MSTARRSTALVAAGILLTRLLGLVRERVFAHYFGLGLEADAFRAALRIPNVIRNLLGEGTLSASFIPVYTKLLERGETERAGAVAGSILALLATAAAGGAVVGIVFAPTVTSIVAGGFTPEAQALTTRLVRILFPMAGVMVLSAWCLGVLNSHRKFFLSYAAPTLWNIAQIGTLVGLGGVLMGADLVTALAWGTLVGAGLQFFVQVPSTVKVLGAVRFERGGSDAHVRDVVRTWMPVVFGAGVLQISSIVDTRFASSLGQGAVANLGYAQLIALLPVSLFGLSVAAVSLPEFSRDAGTDDAQRLAARMGDGLQRALFFLIPSTVALVLAGHHVVGPLLQTGEFGREQTEAVAAVLFMFGLGLPARGLIRLVASGHYALGDTRTPVGVASITVVLAAGLAYVLMQTMGVPGIALGGSIAAFVNVALNYALLRRRIGPSLRSPEQRAIAIAVGSAGVAAAAGLGVEAMASGAGLWVEALATLGAIGIVYLGVAAVLGHREARRVVPF